MNILSNRIVCLAVKSTIGRLIGLMAVLIVIAGAHNISAETELRIVGGHEVNPPFQYTWMAALISNWAPSGDVRQYQFCGGTLIQMDLVMLVMLTMMAIRFSTSMITAD